MFIKEEEKKIVEMTNETIKKTANTSMLEKVFILLSAFSFDLQEQA